MAETKTEEYIPYGPLWEKEMSKFPKLQLIKMLGIAYQKNKAQEEVGELVKAAREILHLHICEQEGLSSGQPTREQWLQAVDNLSGAVQNLKQKEQK